MRMGTSGSASFHSVKNWPMIWPSASLKIRSCSSTTFQQFVVSWRSITLPAWKKGARTTPSRWLYEPETLSEGLTPHLESQAQHVSAAKAACTLERLCPIKERGSGIGDCDDGGGVVLKRITARPRWRDCVGFANRAESR